MTLIQQFRKEHPETIGEKDRAFDNSNYIDWLERKLKVSEADKDEILGDFAQAERQLLELDPSGESLSATGVYEILESFRDKLLGK